MVQIGAGPASNRLLGRMLGAWAVAGRGSRSPQPGPKRKGRTRLPCSAAAAPPSRAYIGQRRILPRCPCYEQQAGIFTHSH